MSPKGPKKSSPKTAPPWRTVLRSGVTETYFDFAETLSPVKAAFSDASQRPSVRFPHDAMKLSMRLSCGSERRELYDFLPKADRVSKSGDEQHRALTPTHAPAAPPLIFVKRIGTSLCFATCLAKLAWKVLIVGYAARSNSRRSSPRI